MLSLLFCASLFCVCFIIRNLLDGLVAAFWHVAFHAFSPIKHEKREKQSAVFLMGFQIVTNGLVGGDIVELMMGGRKALHPAGA